MFYRGFHLCKCLWCACAFHVITYMCYNLNVFFLFLLGGRHTYVYVFYDLRAGTFVVRSL